MPLGAEPEATAVTLIITATPQPATPTIEANEVDDLDSLLQFSEEEPTASVNTEDSGSFGSSVGITTQTPEAVAELATLEGTATAEGSEIEAADEEAEEVLDEEIDPPTNTPSPTETPVIPSTSTPTSIPTGTPTPTLEPTQTVVPPLGETAVIQTGGNTLWVRQTPGGRILNLLNDGDTVVLSDGIANWNGEVWQEIRTLSGALGWVQFEFILIDATQ